VSARGLVPLSVVGDVLVTEAGWAGLPQEALVARAAELAAELRVPVVAGWRRVPSVAEAGADAMAAAARARRAEIQAEIAAAIATVQEEPAPGPDAYTDLPGHQAARQHEPWAGRIT
jgi:hypothetical protein